MRNCGSPAWIVDGDRKAGDPSEVMESRVAHCVGASAGEVDDAPISAGTARMEMEFE